MDTALDDVRFLADSSNRVDALAALAESPSGRDDLQTATGASAPTVGRILGDFEDRGWVRRDGHEYALTEPGAFVAGHFASMLDRMETERHLRDVWQWLPGDLEGFSIDLVADATVTAVEPGDPYAPVNRCASFYHESEHLRGFDAALTAPHHFEEMYQRIVEGMETEVVFPPDVTANIAETYPEKAAEVVESDALTLWVHDDLPLYRVLVFDDRIGVGGYHPDNGVLQAYVDTTDPAAREWALSTYESYREEAWQLTPERSSV